MKYFAGSDMFYRYLYNSSFARSVYIPVSPFVLGNAGIPVHFNILSCKLLGRHEPVFNYPVPYIERTVIFTQFIDKIPFEVYIPQFPCYLDRLQRKGLGRQARRLPRRPRPGRCRSPDGCSRTRQGRDEMQALVLRP